MGGVGDWGVGYNGVGGVCDWSGIIKTPTPTPPLRIPHSHFTISTPYLGLHSIHSPHLRPTPVLELPTPLGDKGIVPTPYLIILSTPKSREGRIRRGATPNSARLQPSLGHGRERMSGVFSHVTTMQLEGSQNSVVWKGREAEGDTSLALSRQRLQTLSK